MMRSASVCPRSVISLAPHVGCSAIVWFIRTPLLASIVRFCENGRLLSSLLYPVSVRFPSVWTRRSCSNATSASAGKVAPNSVRTASVRVCGNTCSIVSCLASTGSFGRSYSSSRPFTFIPAMASCSAAMFEVVSSGQMVALPPPSSETRMRPDTGELALLVGGLAPVRELLR